MGKHEKTKEKKAKHIKKKKHIGLKILLIFIIIIAIIAGIFAYKVHELDGNWLAVLFGHNKHTLENLDKVYVLLMGESTGMSDTIIIASYDPKTQEASMLSIPRDTYIDNGDRYASAYNKINSIYNSGKNPEKTLEAVNELTGLEIKYYMLIDTKALTELVNQIGGIDYDVPINMKYDDASQDLHINLKAGWQHLNGDQVEQLVRFRHNADGSTYPYEYGMEDLGRMKTQRGVITAVAKQTIQLKNVKEIEKILDIVKKYVKTNMNFADLKDYIPYGINMDPNNIRSEQLPGTPKYISGIAFFVHDEEETEELVKELFLGIPKVEEVETN